ncbi:MAG TPA: DNA adenine methylase [Rhodanobacteraceae bacterium]|nr:DNA adenine methylase [Rhodanobacteraceae bacterium]
MQIPHPVPYQGSKRKLAPLIAPRIPRDVGTLFEPFAGSAAMTLHAAQHGLAKRFVLGDSLEGIVELWRGIVEQPEQTAAHYRAVWSGQPRNDPDYFNRVRARYNRDRDPVDLLYLICRCVKNAVRFNSCGEFTQSVDRRRLGMRPDRMRSAVLGASQLLRGRVEFRHGDWQHTTADAGARDFLYLDPPYLGTSVGRDKRYHRQLAPAELIEGLANLRARGVRFALSYDGSTGGRHYGPPLPEHLGLTRLLIEAGRSSQATLVGRDERTIESLYLSPELVALDAVPRDRFNRRLARATPANVKPESLAR